MQTMADVMNKPILVARSEQTCALGTAMAAAVAGGAYSSVDEAIKNMGSGMEKEYHPNPENVRKYELLYRKYIEFGKFIENNLTNS